MKKCSYGPYPTNIDSHCNKLAISKEVFLTVPRYCFLCKSMLKSKTFSKGTNSTLVSLIKIDTLIVQKSNPHGQRITLKMIQCLKVDWKVDLTDWFKWLTDLNVVCLFCYKRIRDNCEGFARWTNNSHIACNFILWYVE